jgi:hypothetical protein
MAKNLSVKFNVSSNYQQTQKEGRRKKEEGSSATDSVADVTDVTDGWKKEEERGSK